MRRLVLSLVKRSVPTTCRSRVGMYRDSILHGNDFLMDSSVEKVVEAFRSEGDRYHRLHLYKLHPPKSQVRLGCPQLIGKF